MEGKPRCQNKLEIPRILVIYITHRGEEKRPLDRGFTPTVPASNAHHWLTG